LRNELPSKEKDECIFKNNAASCGVLNPNGNKMLDTLQISQLILSLSLIITTLKNDFRIATIIMVLLFVALYLVR